MKILADATLPGLQSAFTHPFELSIFNNADELSRQLPKQDILLCRSTLKVDENLLKTSKLAVVATASSGIDHIDQNYLASRNIQLLDAKGANSTAVADYVLACLAFLKIHHQFNGKRAGIIGMGAVGTTVSRYLQAANLTVIGYDPLRALRDPQFNSAALAEISQCDLICIHANLHDSPLHGSRNLINEQFLAKLKANTVIINAARGGIVAEHDLLSHHSLLHYCTDVYCHEPAVSNEIIEFATLCTPHIAGHTVEAKLNAVHLLSQKLHHFCNLPLPGDANTTVQTSGDFNLKQDWPEIILSLYNPNEETSALKSALNKEQVFLALRKTHFRHEFKSAVSPLLDQKTDS